MRAIGIWGKVMGGVGGVRLGRQAMRAIGIWGKVMGGVGEPPGTTGDAGDRDMGEGYGWGGGVRLGRQAMRAIGV